MTAQAALAAMAHWIHGPGPSARSGKRFERLKQHIVDTVGARLAGSRIAEGRAIARVARSMHDEVGAAIVTACAQARCTEVDDIHLASCTTPGAVVVSTALALASTGGLRSTGEFCAAVLAGYEALVRLGAAIDGPFALHRRVWPTHAAAAFGSAATASRAYRLDAGQTAGALATALAFGSGPPVPAASASSSRWLTLGIAAANGELAARSAAVGVLGAIGGVSPWPRLTAGLGRRHLFDEVGLKPFPTARQALAAIEAARDIVQANGLRPADIDRISVGLPDLQRRIVDHPGLPASRFVSMVSVQYQVALAIVAPERLADVARTPPYDTRPLRRLLPAIRVRRARDLDSRYPRAWPARVEIAAGGRRFVRVVLHPAGDARRPFGWDQVAQKFAGLAGIGDAAAHRAVRAMRDAAPGSRMPALWRLES